VKANSGEIFKFGIGRRSSSARRGDLRAFSASVPSHCTVQYRTDLTQIWCACHNGTTISTARTSKDRRPPAGRLRGERGGNQIVVSKSA